MENQGVMKTKYDVARIMMERAGEHFEGEAYRYALMQIVSVVLGDEDIEDILYIRHLRNQIENGKRKAW